MKTYSYVRMLVDHKETALLEIFREHNTFRVFEYDENVFCGSHLKVVEYIENWKKKYDGIIKMLKAAGRCVEFEQTIK